MNAAIQECHSSLLQTKVLLDRHSTRALLPGPVKADTDTDTDTRLLLQCCLRKRAGRRGGSTALRPCGCCRGLASWRLRGKSIPLRTSLCRFKTCVAWSNRAQVAATGQHLDGRRYVSLLKRLRPCGGRRQRASRRSFHPSRRRPAGPPAAWTSPAPLQTRCDGPTPALGWVGGWVADGWVITRCLSELDVRVSVYAGRHGRSV